MPPEIQGLYIKKQRIITDETWSSHVTTHWPSILSNAAIQIYTRLYVCKSPMLEPRMIGAPAEVSRNFRKYIPCWHINSAIKCNPRLLERLLLAPMHPTLDTKPWDASWAGLGVNSADKISRSFCSARTSALQDPITKSNERPANKYLVKLFSITELELNE